MVPFYQEETSSRTRLKMGSLLPGWGLRGQDRDIITGPAVAPVVQLWFLWSER